MDVSNNFAHLKEPHKFQLLLRGSRDGFTSKKFHELCDGIPNTVIFIKVKGTEEILGGYNPSKWESSINTWGQTKDSFIFSFKNNNAKDAIISNIENPKHAIYNGKKYGPQFGNDINIQSNNGEDYDYIYYTKSHYEKEIRATASYFSIEDYEVFKL